MLSSRNLCSAIMLLLSAGACRDVTEPEPEPVAPVASLDITVPRDTVDRGDTVQLAVVARDAQGGVLENRRVEWTVQGSGGSFLAVDAKGKAVVLQAPGDFLTPIPAVVVQVTADGVSDVDTLYVAHAPARLKLSNSALVRVGRTREMAATFYDRFDYDLPRRPVRWSSSDATVASVTQAGIVTALREGTATITGRIAGVSASQQLRVVAGGYSLTVLGTLGGSHVEVYDLNDHGQVVGVSQLAGETWPRAFSWHNGQMRDLGAGAQRSAAYAVNNQGVIVGLFDGPARWVDGVPARLHTPEGLVHGRAVDMDEQGRVVVHGDNRSLSLWVNGDTTDVSSGRLWVHANGMNGNGAVAGGAWGTDPYEAVLLQNGAIQSLGNSRIEAHATAVNDRGDVVGINHKYRPSWKEGFLRKDGAMVTLGQLGGDYLEPWDLNERTEVVGWGKNAHDEERAFVWANGVLAELTDLLATPGWVVLRADAINESGQIAAVGVNTTTGARSAILLSPLP